MMCTLQQYTHLRRDFEDELMDQANRALQQHHNFARQHNAYGPNFPDIWECILEVWYGFYAEEADNLLNEMILVDILYWVLSNKDVDGGWDVYWPERLNFFCDRTGWSREYRSLWIDIPDHP